jgi:hypothetical protein
MQMKFLTIILPTLSIVAASTLIQTRAPDTRRFSACNITLELTYYYARSFNDSNKVNATIRVKSLKTKEGDTVIGRSQYPTLSISAQIASHDLANSSKSWDRIAPQVLFDSPVNLVRANRTKRTYAASLRPVVRKSDRLLLHWVWEAGKSS